MPPRSPPSAYKSAGWSLRRRPGIMNERGTQLGSRRRMPDPAPTAASICDRVTIVGVLPKFVDDITPATADQGCPFRTVQCAATAILLFLECEQAFTTPARSQNVAHCETNHSHNVRVIRRLHEGRRAVSIENDWVRLTVLEGGGHIAEVLDKATGVNPLWTPPWPSIEPGDFDHVTHPGYGSGPAESRLLSALIGHNLCLDFFGGPSPEEEAAGLSAHAEGSISVYTIDGGDDAASLVMRARLPIAQLDLERHISLHGP